ncbi:MAG: hypothetical protein P4M01_12245 [Acidobacteriota bacterium]|nr:hypothetical protein [Acidobacteriota bacterium]
MKPLGQIAKWTVLVFLLAGVAVAAQAEVGVLLNEALHTGASRWTGAGHTAVYVSGVCADSPVSLRPCRKGENGVVLTNYSSFDEDSSYEWNAVPLNLYLYGVEDERDRTLYATPTVRWVLEERYRERYLGGICHGPCATRPGALWRESIGTTFDRDIYMFVARTTPEQDRALIARLMQAPNVNRYNAMRNNCADFVSLVLNSYYPGAARPDRVNDFGMTSPKAIAKSFARYGARHPETGFHVVRYSQIPGEFRPSADNRKGTEELWRANKWRVPFPFVAPVAAASYLLSGRFNPEKELQQRPTAEATRLMAELRQTKRNGNAPLAAALEKKLQAERASALGTDAVWREYAEKLRQRKEEAAESGALAMDRARGNPEAAILPQKWITTEPGGGLWLVPRDGHGPKIGLSESTLLEGPSDVRQGYVLALARVDAELRRKPKNRATLGFFRRDWAEMEKLRLESLSMQPIRRAENASGEAQ